MSFSRKGKRITDKMRTQQETMKKKIIYDWFAGVIMRTPVMDGRARANWLPSFADPVQTTIEDLDGLSFGSPPSTVKANQILSSIKKGDGVTYMTNNLPYIKRLEDGYSPQAVGGMVKLSLMDVARRFK